MSHPKVADLRSLLQALVGAGVQFILVGGAAAVIHGAPITTQDVDIVPERDPDNISSLGRDIDANGFAWSTFRADAVLLRTFGGREAFRKPNRDSS